MSNHRWSGWPGAFCLKCGQEDKMEIAIGDCLFDPYTKTWEDGIDPKDFNNGKCPISDEEYEKWLNDHEKRMDDFLASDEPE